MIAFKMNRISIEQFAILTQRLPDDNPTLNLETNLSFSAAVGAHMIVAKMRFAYLHNDAPLLILELSCQFELEQESWDSLIEENKVVIPKDFLAHMAVHTVGTARGILFCKTEQTTFSQFILPPINVAEQITHDFIIDLK